MREPEPNAGTAGLRAETQGITLTNVATGETFEVTANLATEPGAGLERRRLMLHVENPPTAGTQVRLEVGSEALEDFFANRAEVASDWTFAWPANGMSVVEDTARPELLRALLKDSKVELTFSEPVTTTGLATAVTIDGTSTTTWTTSADGLVATTTSALPAGAHQVEISTSPIDLAGKGLANSVSLDLTVSSAERRDLAGIAVLLFEAINQREVPFSPTGQQASFQGHPVDEETGFVYLRNRYFDPEMGRFITADPLGNVDGPSEYAFGAGDWVNSRDPMGLCFGWFAKTEYCQKRAEEIAYSLEGAPEALIAEDNAKRAMIVAFREWEGRFPRKNETVYIDWDNRRELQGDGEWHDISGRIEPDHAEWAIVGVGFAARGGFIAAAGLGTGRQLAAAGTAAADELAGQVIGVNPSLVKGLARHATKATLTRLQGSFSELAEQRLLPRFCALDPNLNAGYTGSFKTGVVGNPKKATFGQPIDLNDFDIDYWIESDIWYKNFGSDLVANPEFREILSKTPGFEGLRPNKEGFSIKFKPPGGEP